MAEIATVVLITMAKKMLTEKLFARLLVYGLHQVSMLTTNTLDDKSVAALADALGVSDYR